MNDITDEILDLAKQRYPPGTRYINPSFIIDDHSDKPTTFNKFGIINHKNPGMIRHERVMDNKVGIIPSIDSQGFVYLDGLWADIVDDNDYIIQSFNQEHYSLEKARDIIYKE